MSDEPKPIEFEIMQERILDGLQDFARACAEAEAWWTAYKASARQRPPVDDLEGFG